MGPSEKSFGGFQGRGEGTKTGGRPEAVGRPVHSGRGRSQAASVVVEGQELDSAGADTPDSSDVGLDDVGIDAAVREPVSESWSLNCGRIQEVIDVDRRF